MGLWDKVKSGARTGAAVGTLGASEMAFQPGANPFTQSQTAQGYDPNQQNFQVGQDPNANAQTSRYQDIAAGQGQIANQQVQQGNAAQQQQNQQQNVAHGYRGNIGGAQNNAQNALAMQQDAMQMGGPQMATGQSDQSRGMQQDQLAALNAFAQGPQGPSGAQAMLNNQLAGTERSNMSLAQSGPGGASSGNMRAALAQNTMAQGQAGNASAMLAAQEAATARGQNLQALTAAQAGAGNIRGMDVGVAGQQLGADVASRGQNVQLSGQYGNQALGYEGVAQGWAGQSTGAEQIGLGYGQQALGFNEVANQTNQIGLGYEQLGQNAQQMGQQGGMGYEQLRGQGVNAANIANMQGETNRDAATLGMAGGILQTGMMMSDEDSKKQIEELTNMNKELLTEINSLKAPMPDVRQPGPEYQSQAQGGSAGLAPPQMPDNPYTSGMAAGAAAHQASLSAGLPSADPFAGDTPAEMPTVKQPNMPDMGAAVAPMRQQSIDPYSFLQSDERSKQRIQELEKENSTLASFLMPQESAAPMGYDDAALQTVRGAPAHSYEYKDPSMPGAKPGPQVGVMAQDLEKGPLGSTLVQDTPQGKMVDTARLTTVNTGAIAAQQREIDALNAALKEGRPLTERQQYRDDMERTGGVNPRGEDPGPNLQARVLDDLLRRYDAGTLTGSEIMQLEQMGNRMTPEQRREFESLSRGGY